MTRIALGCFEEQPDGSWFCRRRTIVKSRSGLSISVEKGRLFRPGTTFASYADFTEYLASVSEPRPPRSPHED
jgi:hypothetical protein